ncbi:MAG TPA: ABC transporter permease, partial [Anaerolineales bacterium]|nr:ABC transporter permease [Anaerolineales bacterium]
MTTVSKAPQATPTPQPAGPREVEAQVFVAPQWKLVWWKFRKHKMAMASGIILTLIYLVALFADFLAPFDPTLTNSNYLYVPPQGLHVDVGKGKPGIYVYGVTSTVDPIALRREFKLDPSQVIPLKFWVRGWEYKLLGIFKTDVHLFGPVNPVQPAYLMGADRLGRDLLSRMIMGTRVSMSIGLVGVFFSLILGIFLGGISGYYGGSWDQLIQRTIDFLRSIPSIPLWMGLAAAMPLQWPAERVYFAITVILSLIGWTSLARVVRGRFLSLREEDFVTAARLDGASQPRIIFWHMLPAFTSHIIASITLAIPGMIISETSLSFLGLGLREPVVSWGVLLQDAQDIRNIATAPWLLIPAIAVVVSV